MGVSVRHLGDFEGVKALKCCRILKKNPAGNDLKKKEKTPPWGMRGKGEITRDSMLDWGGSTGKKRNKGC